MFEDLKQKQEQKKQEQQMRAQAEVQRKQEEKKLISTLLNKREERQKVPVSKKKYIRLCLLGIFGAHRFYAKQYVTGTIYLLLFWTGISISMTLIDWMIVAPMEPDENGNIML